MAAARAKIQKERAKQKKTTKNKTKQNKKTKNYKEIILSVHL